MTAIDDLQNLPLSQLFSGPLVAAIDASVEAQTETVALLRERGYDDEGNLVTVTFDYTTSEPDPETGGTRRVAKQIEIPLLLFLSLPNLVIHEIEEEFSAKLTEIETEEEEDEAAASATADIVPQPLRASRLRVRPAGRSTALDRKTRSTFDLNVRMVAELQNQSTGMELLERVANTATEERLNAAKTKRLAEERRRETDGGETRGGETRGGETDDRPNRLDHEPDGRAGRRTTAVDETRRRRSADDDAGPAAGAEDGDDGSDGDGDDDGASPESGVEDETAEHGDDEVAKRGDDEATERSDDEAAERSDDTGDEASE